MTLKTSALLFILLLSSILLAQQSTIQQSRASYNKGVEAYKAKDFSTSQAYFEKSLKLRPYHPGLMYTVAALQSINNEAEHALNLLQKVADMGLVYKIAEDSDFDNIKETEQFKQILQKMETSLEPVSNSQIAFKLDEKDLVTESVAYDKKTGRFFITSVYKRKIVMVDKNGQSKDFVPEATGGIWSIFALRIARDRNSLWASTSAMAETKDTHEAEIGEAGIFEFDLTTGTFKRKFVLADSIEHVFGDFIFDEKNQIIISDSKSAKIYSLDISTGAFQAIYSGNNLSSPQGLVRTENGTLVIADYAQGLFKLNLNSGELLKIATPDNICLLGIDGLYIYKGDLIAVQNGVRPNRVIRLKINSNANKVTALEVLEANNPVIDDPTLGTIIDNQFYYIANSQWSAFGQDGIKPAEELNQPVVLKANLQ